MEKVDADHLFLANMSHEIRTPLNGVLGALDLLSSTGLSVSQEDLLNTAQSSGDMLLHLLNDLLDYTKIGAGGVELESISFDLHQLLFELKKIMGLRAHKANLSMELHFEDLLPHWVEGDPHRLKQILYNLIGNAIKFTAKGVVSIDVSHININDEISLECNIKDTGIGIKSENLDRIFVPFSQQDRSTTRRFGGTGLGLPISRMLAQMMKGDIRITSKPGEGSTFTLQITLKKGSYLQNDHVTQNVACLKKKQSHWTSISC